MLKFLKFGKIRNPAEIAGELKETETKFINSVNAELIKLNTVNNCMYEICPVKTERTGYKTGCNCCNECKKLKGVI